MRRVLKQIVLPLMALGGCLALTMCGGGESSSGTGTSTGNPCSNGICPSTSSGGGNGGASTGSMTTTGPGGTTTGPGGTGGASTGAMTTGVGGGTSSSSVTSSATGGCVESWLCTPWDGKGTDNGTRVCTDINNCGTMVNKPVEAATLPALDDNYYKCNVEPILDRKCSMLGCHGTEQGRALRVYARGRLRDATGGPAPLNATQGCTMPPIPTLQESIGTNDCHQRGPHAPVEWQKNYDAARGMDLQPDGQPIPAGMEATSDLIAQPVVGGKSHAGIHLFKAGDAEYTTIKNWLGGATLASCDPTPN